VTLTGLGGGELVPMLYGHPVSDNDARSAINLGLQKFHYDTSDLRDIFENDGANVAAFKPGIGIHQRPLE
jgi:hypothetical protein